MGAMAKRELYPARFLLAFSLTTYLCFAWGSYSVAAALAIRDKVVVTVNPLWSDPGDPVTLAASGLPAFWQVEAGLRTSDGRRETVRAAWTDGQGSLRLSILLPETSPASETWQGMIRVRAGEEMIFLSTNTIRVKPGPLTYRVKKGDTLGVIAGWFHTTVADILEINPGLQSSRRIYVGQILAIPWNSANEPSPAARRGYHIPDFTGFDYRQSVVRGVLGEVWEQIQGEKRWIEVDLSTQTTRAYQGTKLERTFIVSTGRRRTPTVTGTYHIYVKYPATDMSGPGYHLEDVPYTMYFYKGYGLHGTYWHNNFGRPMSHGCVNFRVEDAKWLYDFASVGTLVYVHD